MTTYYLRVEGVNLGRFVDDTNNLSVTRGASLALLDAIEAIHTHLQQTTRGWVLEKVSSGASSGLWSFSATSEEANAIRDKVRDFIAAHPVLQHATAVVSVVPDTGVFQSDKETALANNRWQQMRALSVAVPAHNTQPTTAMACRLDGVRPAVQNVPRKVDDVPGRTPSSASTCARHDYGRDNKQSFYRRETGLTLPFGFAKEFSEVASGIARHPLRDKLAVAYTDGNGFSKVQEKFCTDQKTQKDYDGGLQRLRRQFLTAFLQSLPKGRTAESADWLWRIPDSELSEDDKGHYRYRFETLLWGGDDLMWVMPAWQGWHFAQTFFAHAEQWRIGDHRLTQSMGLVFCHHHAPIARVKALAKELADFSKQESGRDRNNLAYEILESFDHLATDVKRAWRKRCPKDALPADLILSGPPPDGTDGPRLLSSRMADFANRLRALKFDGTTEFPRSQLRRLALTQATAARDDVRLAAVRIRFFELWSPASELQDKLSLRECSPAVPGGQSANWELWTHLESLWDYAAPEPVAFAPKEIPNPER